MFYRKAYISIEYVDTCTNNGIFRVLKSYTINIQKGKRLWFMDGLNPNNTKEVIDVLKEAQKEKRGIQLEKKMRGGTQEYILIPKWAMKEIIEQIYNCIGYTSTKK